MLKIDMKKRFIEGFITMKIDLTSSENTIKWTPQNLRENLLSEVLRPEQIVVIFPDTELSSMYVGRIAYAKRDMFNKENVNDKKYADSDSFVNSRRRVIRDVLIALADPEYVYTTINGYLRRFLEIFDWCDSKLTYDFTRTVSNASAAYKEYTNELVNDLKTGRYSSTTASGKQLIFRQLLKSIFPNEDVDKEIFNKTKRVKRGLDRNLEAPDRDNVDYQLYMFIKIFEQLSDQVTTHKNFPFYFKCDEYESHIIPTVKGGFDYILTPFNEGKESPYFNFKEGKMFSTEEAQLSKYPQSKTLTLPQKGVVRNALRKFKSVMKESNADPRCYARISLANMAMNCYYFIFLHATGMNHQPLADLKFDGKYEIEKSVESKEYRVIKFRSGGREVSFTLGRIAIKLFKKYLSLRRWMLDGTEFEYLFFSSGHSKGKFITPRKVKSNISAALYERLEGRFIPPALSRLGSAKLRKFKSDVLISMGEDITVSSKLLQHLDEKTAAESYADGNKHKQQEEFSNYWKAVDALVLGDSNELTKTASGACKDYGEPIPVNDETAIKPSCNLPQGCLFCQHYMIHSDEEDLFKIISLKYFIEAVMEEFPDIEHVVILYADLLARINEIINHMESINEDVANIVAMVRKKVFDEHQIHNFWDLRLQRFERMGVVTL